MLSKRRESNPRIQNLLIASGLEDRRAPPTTLLSQIRANDGSRLHNLCIGNATLLPLELHSHICTPSEIQTHIIPIRVGCINHSAIEAISRASTWSRTKLTCLKGRGNRLFPALTDIRWKQIIFVGRGRIELPLTTWIFSPALYLLSYRPKFVPSRESNHA